MTMTERLRSLYRDETRRARRFQYGLLIFDLATIAYVVATSFVAHTGIIIWIDIIIGIVILADFLVRARIDWQGGRFLTRFSNWADAVAVLSFLGPLFGAKLGFLRVLRTLRLLHTYQTLRRLRADFPWFRRHEEISLASVNLFVFVFVMTGLIYAAQVGRNPDISNYIDALYFTVATLTTTGFGDIILEGTFGRTLAVAVMIFGVTLFLRLVQVLLRPAKVRHECGDCGLLLHDADAVHCKHCGTTIHIRTHGEV